MNRKKITVGIGEAAALTGTTPAALRRQHRSGLLPEPEREPGYGYEDLVRILWARRLTELGLPPHEVREVLAPDAGPEELLARLAAAVRARRPEPEAGQLLGPAAARLEAAGRHLLVLHPRLRVEQERLEAELAALAGAEAADPRVERLAHDWFVHIRALEAAERAACFPEPDFTDAEPAAAGPAPTAPGPGPAASAALAGEISPAQARVAELLDALLGAWPGPDPHPAD
ncbi:MerR family transcriptional regulator [Streptomyces sp. NPDC002054]|uniref:helix-turn-helix domain-containing protein n=1 Tax=Streptomyces sp. NPDC002054 TaxID=3154663 RepID=UPI003329DB37